MVAYKIWHDTKHFIHESTTCELNVFWTTDRTKAKVIENRIEANEFFYDHLGFNPNKVYDKLILN